MTCSLPPHDRTVTARGLGWAASMLIMLFALGLLAACSPTDGDDGTFKSIGTTNTDFDTPLFYTTGNYPISQASGDLDGDTDQDLVVFNRLGDNYEPLKIDEPAYATLSVFLNGGGGTSFTLSTISLGSLGTTVGGGVVKVGALNAGVNDDIVVLINNPSDPRLWVCTDAPTCAGAATFSLGGVGAQMELANVDGNGLQDVIVTIPSTNQIFVLLDGTTAVTPVPTTTDATPGRFAVGSFDVGTGDDLAVLHPGSLKVGVMLSNGDGTFSETTYDLASTPNFIAKGDFDGADVDDFAITHTTGNTISKWLGNADGSSFSGTTYTVDEDPQFLITGDFEGDTKDELAATHRLKVFISYLDNSFSATQNTVTRDPFDLVPGEVNGVAGLDLLVVEREDRALSILAGNGAGGFSRTYIGFDHSLQNPLLVDLGGTVQLDLVVIQPLKDRIAVLLNRNP